MAVNEQTQDYESELAQARMEETNRRLEEQKQIASQSRYLKMMKIGAGEDVKQQAADIAKQKIKKEIKKRILIWIGGVLAEIFILPPIAIVTWTIIGILFIAAFGYWCVTTPVKCVSLFGTGIGALIDLIVATLRS